MELEKLIRSLNPIGDKVLQNFVMSKVLPVNKLDSKVIIVYILNSNEYIICIPKYVISLNKYKQFVCKMRYLIIPNELYS